MKSMMEEAPGSSEVSFVTTSPLALMKELEVMTSRECTNVVSSAAVIAANPSIGTSLRYNNPVAGENLQSRLFAVSGTVDVSSGISAFICLPTLQLPMLLGLRLLIAQSWFCSLWAATAVLLET